MASQEVQSGPRRPQPNPPASPATPEPVKPSVAHNADPKTVPQTVHVKGEVG
jgi:hypothetical protein